MILDKITNTGIVIIGNQLYMRKFYDAINASSKLFFTTNEDYLEHVRKTAPSGDYKGASVIRQPYPVVNGMLKEDANLFAFVSSLHITANEFAIQELYHRGEVTSATSLISLPDKEGELPYIVSNDSFYIPEEGKGDKIYDKANLKIASANAGKSLARGLHSSLQFGPEPKRLSESFGLPKLTYKGA